MDDHRCEICKCKLRGGYSPKSMEWDNKLGENEDGKGVYETVKFESDQNLCDNCFKLRLVYNLNAAVAEIRGSM